MDAIILAAGKGSRLDGIAAPFHKPLLVMGGESLIVRAVRQALTVAHCDRAVVIAAPENANVIAQLIRPLGQDVDMVVQMHPTGPGDALLLGLRHVRRDVYPDVLVLMADNYTSHADIERMTHGRTGPAVGVRSTHSSMVDAFTYMTARGWVEKEKPPLSDTHYLAWIGPIVSPGDKLRYALVKQSYINDERPIGPSFNVLQPETLEVDTIDIGTPEAWL